MATKKNNCIPPQKNAPVKYVEASLVPSEDLFTTFKVLIQRGLFAIHPYSWLKKYITIYYNSRSETDYDNRVIFINTIKLGGNVFRYGGGRVVAKIKNKNEDGYYLCNPEVNRRYIEDMEKLGVTENSIRYTIAAIKPYLQTEYKIGKVRDRIDLKSSDTIAEIKKIKSWKQALGQLLAYSHMLPRYKRVLILFGNLAKKEEYQFILEVCSLYDISVEFINSEINDNSQVKRISI